MNFLLLSPDTLSRDMALTRCLPSGNLVKVLHPEESLTVCREGSRKKGESSSILPCGIEYSGSKNQLLNNSVYLTFSDVALFCGISQY